MKRILVFILVSALALSISFAAEKPVAPTSTKTAVAIATPSAPAKAEATATARLWNLQDADIISVINEVSLETGKNFVIDPRVTGKISLISSKPIKPNQVYEIFLSVLGMLGYSAIPSGNVVKIVPNMESSEYASRVADKNAPGRGDEVVVRVIPLENVAANQIIPVIRPMLPQWSNVSTYTPGNVIILLGRAGNLNRIVDVIHRVDRVSNTNIDVVPLHRASASQIATILTNLQNAGRATGDTPQVSIVADERTNSVLLGGNQAARAHMKLLVNQLDTPSAGAQGNTEVFYLKYLQAKNFAPILGKIAQNIQGKGDGSIDTPAPATTSTSGTTGKTPAAPENRTSIQAEPSTNALIITAPPTLMSALRTVIAKLDIRPAQVLVEAIIVEVDLNDLKNLGIQWGSQPPAGSVNPDGSFNPSMAANASTFGASANVSFPPLGEGTLGIIPGSSIRAVLSALENKTGVNILSTPSVVVLDNRKATLSVGQNIAEQNGSYSTTNGTGTISPFNTFDRKDVVLKLDVQPQINLSNSVRLGLALSNDTLQNPQNPGLNPVINTSKIQNSVIVNSNDILVIGGLISNTLTESTDKIPIIGDVPVIGNLFKHTNREYQKKNLIVFIKPTIMHTAEDAEIITNEKYNFARNVQIKQTDLQKVQDSKLDYILPTWQSKATLPRPFENGNG